MSSLSTRVSILLLAVALLGAYLHPVLAEPTDPAKSTPATGTVVATAPGTAVPPAQGTTATTIPPTTTPPVEQAAPKQGEQKAADTPAEELPVFGRDLFSADATTFEPNGDAPVPPDYVLGAGDTLAVVCWQGATEYERANATITPDGKIYLKLIGSLPIAPLTLAQTEQLLRKRYAQYYKNFNLTVQVVGRRTIPVYVMGEVRKPGKYQLSSLSTIFTALYAAQGPSDIGSLRGIRILRGGKTVATIDLYDYLLRGTPFDQPLKAGDTIFVPMAGKVVAVSGEVRRAARYELLASDTLQDALALAGGTTANSADRVRLSRVGDNRQRQVQDLVLPTAGTLPLRDGDQVLVAPVLTLVRNAVRLIGAVNRPGPYPIEKAVTVGGLLKLAEGVTPEAYLPQAIVIRQQINEAEQQLPVNLLAINTGETNADLKLLPGDTVKVFFRKELPELYDRVHIDGAVVTTGSYPFTNGMHLTDLVKLGFGPTTDAYLTQALLYRYPIGAPAQMIAIDITKALAGDAAANVMLQPRDRLVIKPRSEVQDLLVQVQGEVNKPGGLTYYAGMKVSDALFLAGGLKPDVAMDRALLIRLNETTYAEELREISLRGVLARDPAQDIILHNGDRLVVYPITQLGEAREVRVDGAVTVPGTYHYTGNMRISHLLFLAQGIRQDAYADRADLQRRRADNTIEIIPINLVEVLKGTLTDANPLLQPRDRLVVSTRQQQEEPRMVKVDGFVRKPGSYSLTAGMKLSDLLFQAGGLRPDADADVHLFRLEGDKVNAQTYTVTGMDGAVQLTTDPLLAANDLISVHGQSNYVRMTETIHLDGAITKPGAYPLFEGERNTPYTLYQVLAKAGGLMPDAYPAGIVLYRKQASIHTERQQQELGRTMRTLDAGVGIPGQPAPANTPAGVDTAGHPTPPDTPAPAPDGRVPGTVPAATPAAVMQQQNADNIAKSLAKVLTTDKGETIAIVIPPRSMQEQQISQSIPVDAEPLLASGGKKGDITLEPGDVIYVPRRPTTVTVLGGVTNNGSVMYHDGQALDSYLDAVGGVAQDGDKKRIVVMRMNGLVLPYKQAKSICPGDIIIVPTKHMLHVINTKGPIERVLRTISEAALSFLPFRN